MPAVVVSRCRRGISVTMRRRRRMRQMTTVPTLVLRRVVARHGPVSHLPTTSTLRHPTTSSASPTAWNWHSERQRTKVWWSSIACRVTSELIRQLSVIHRCFTLEFLCALWQGHLTSTLTANPFWFLQQHDCWILLNVFSPYGRNAFTCLTFN